MLVIEQAKVLALKLNSPARVLDTVRASKMVTLRGQQVVVTPHDIESVIALNDLGISAPSPILHYYDWPSQFQPYDHQRKTSAFLTTNKKCLVLNEIGTGKTQSALWAADYLMSEGIINKVLIISPLSTLERVWGDAIFKGFYERRSIVLRGTADRRKRLIQKDADFYIVNHDGFSIIAAEAINMFDLVIVDEAAVLRNGQTQRFKQFYKWMEKNPQARLWLMTGTPTPNAPTDAWSLAKLVESPYVTERWTAFRDQTMYKYKMHTWIARQESVDIVQHVLQPAIRYTRDDCFDLPDTIVQTRSIELTPDQLKHFNAMMKHLVVEMKKVGNEATISAVNEAVKLQKLVQIACGVAYDDNGNNVEVDCSPRVNAVKEIIEQCDEKVIVFVPLTGTLHMLERELSKHWTVGVVNGEVSSSKRDVIFDNFQNHKDPRVLIAHPATMAHGLTLTSASTIIWYGPINSNEQYTQANGRIERIGKRHISNVIHIESTTVEHKMYERLANKQKLQGLLLDLIKEQTYD